MGDSVLSVVFQRTGCTLSTVIESDQSIDAEEAARLYTLKYGTTSEQVSETPEYR